MISFALCFACLSVARADATRADATRTDTTVDATHEARQLFQRAAELVRAAQWYEALGLFERSNRLRPHSITLFNVAACERALGHYTRARSLYDRISADVSEGAPAPALLAEVQLHARELDALLVHAKVHLDPRTAALTVDGRPLETRSLETSASPILWAGLTEPGTGALPPQPDFELVLDPGAHVITATRAGYSPALIRVSYVPGEQPTLPLELSRLPSRLDIASDRERAAVSIDGTDVGLVPLALTRPPGSYKVVVQKSGFVPYRTTVTLSGGEETALRANLEATRTPVWKKWWFWTATGVVLTGVALGAYFGARAAETPQPDGGGLQWVAKVK